MNNKPLIIITGPTAVGKTSLSIRLASLTGGEIISADSMQVYKHMNIGTAKIKPEEMNGIPHHMIDIIEPTQEFNVYLFKKMCNDCIEEIYERGKLPIIVGGTGFYIQAVLKDVSFHEEEENQEIRKRLEEEAVKYGNKALHDRLKEVDLISYETIHENNIKRIIRALEFYEITGKPISKHNTEEKQRESSYNYAYFVLNKDRKTLYEDINKRVDIMKDNGLTDEIKALIDMGVKSNMTSMQGIGYRELIDNLSSNESIEEAYEKIKLDTRRFAKRQLTWFKHEKDVIWIDKDSFKDEDEILDFCLNELKSKKIL